MLPMLRKLRRWLLDLRREFRNGVSDRVADVCSAVSEMPSKLLYRLLGKLVYLHVLHFPKD